MKIFIGKVTAKTMMKTATVVVSRDVQHPLYGKRMKRTKKYSVHDEIDVKVGDMVRFVGSRPYSKTKRWKLIEVIGEKQKAKPVAKKTKKEVKEPAKKATKKAK
jgi:small subunit ribosomal protein S17